MRIHTDRESPSNLREKGEFVQKKCTRPMLVMAMRELRLGRPIVLADQSPTKNINNEKHQSQQGE